MVDLKYHGAYSEGSQLIIRSRSDAISCLNEKVEIAMHKENYLLNRRREFVSKCRHQNKYKLSKMMSFRCGKVNDSLIIIIIECVPTFKIVEFLTSENILSLDL